LKAIRLGLEYMVGKPLPRKEPPKQKDPESEWELRMKEAENDPDYRRDLVTFLRSQVDTMAAMDARDQERREQKERESEERQKERELTELLARRGIRRSEYDANPGMVIPMPTYVPDAAPESESEPELAPEPEGAAEGQRVAAGPGRASDGGSPSGSGSGSGSRGGGRRRARPGTGPSQQPAQQQPETDTVQRLPLTDDQEESLLLHIERELIHYNFAARSDITVELYHDVNDDGQNEDVVVQLVGTPPRIAMSGVRSLFVESNRLRSLLHGVVDFRSSRPFRVEEEKKRKASGGYVPKAPRQYPVRPSGVW